MPKLESGIVCRRLLLKAILIVLFSLLSYFVMAVAKISNAAMAESSSPPLVRLSDGETRHLGWDPEGLDKVIAHLGRLSSDTLMIVTNGRTVAAYGDIARRYHVHSIRKAFLSALIGQHLGVGTRKIDLNATLAELEIDDRPNPLSPLQKQAQVRHLLMSLSGVNHAAAAEAGLTAEKQRRLGDEDNRPGEIWAYNNWDYNVLTSIFERVTETSVAQAFQEGIAQPSGMRDFSTEDVIYNQAPKLSQHRAAMFRMSARDLARFGELYLNRGVVGGKEILASSWIERIESGAVSTGNGGLRDRHGFLWWLPAKNGQLPAGSFWAWGLGQQALFVVPAWDSVVVHQSDTTEFRKRFFALVRGEGMAPPVALETLARSCHEPADSASEFCVLHRFILRREFSQLLSLVAAARREN